MAHPEVGGRSASVERICTGTSPQQGGSRGDLSKEKAEGETEWHNGAAVRAAKKAKPRQARSLQTPLSTHLRGDEERIP